jgi:hypothetical protein
MAVYRHWHLNRILAKRLQQERTTLSWQAKGLHWILMNELPEWWEGTAEETWRWAKGEGKHKRRGPNGRQKFRAVLRELESQGYVQYVPRTCADTGQLLGTDWHIYEVPLAQVLTLPRGTRIGLGTSPPRNAVAMWCGHCREVLYSVTGVCVGCEQHMTRLPQGQLQKEVP